MNRPMYLMMCTALIMSPCFLPRGDRRYTALPVLLGAAGLLVSILTDLAWPWVIGFRRPPFWRDWWVYVDIDAEAQARALA